MNSLFNTLSIASVAAYDLVKSFWLRDWLDRSYLSR